MRNDCIQDIHWLYHELSIFELNLLSSCNLFTETVNKSQRQPQPLCIDLTNQHLKSNDQNNKWKSDVLEFRDNFGHYVQSAIFLDICRVPWKRIL